MEEVDKGYCEFCITVGTVARTAGILIHSQLKALAVNLSWPFGRLRLYAGSVGSNNPRWLKADLVVCENSSFFSWVWAGEFFFCYQLTRVVPDEGPLNGVCVCVCVCVCVFIRLSMKVASLHCDVLLCTHFSQAQNRRANVTQADHLSTECILAVWNCLCRRGCSQLHCMLLMFSSNLTQKT